MSLAVVILAAGKSTRFKSRTPKVLHPLFGAPLLAYSLNVAARVTDQVPVIVVGPETEAEIRAWAGARARCVVQHERLGTGHAVQQAYPLLNTGVDHVLVLYGDMPLLRSETLISLVEHHVVAAAAVTLLTVQRDDPQGFGRIVRDNAGRVKAIVEEVEATPEIAAIRELNSGIYVFETGFLWRFLKKVEPSARKGEYYLTDLIGMAVAAGYPVESITAADPAESLGINTRADMAVAATALRTRVNHAWMLAGVTLIDPATTYIDPTVTIGSDTVIHPNTHLRGQTSIGAACEIGPNTVIEDCEIGNRCHVVASVLESAVMEDDSGIGPFGHLRKGARLCQGAHMGNFGEIKNGTLGPNAKMGHFSYLGDAEVGAGANIGAGAITCNYDGKRKHRTIIGEGAFIGSDTMLVAPVTVGAGARTGAGSVVTRDVPDGALAYGVPARVYGEMLPEKSKESPDREG
ncbi:MAG: bifunctional UDP-N-acetylglucosamine diphosphorylase/glucosamine-1-phosphate N-acetyltransferase GlmU [Anaerolineae bacterium]|nr:bifunctional UDP-N-acetylglucosamine diphosphorylase/glucosamine-1-phosphate N-acetyltransferase GlmU [Anaerolineae bacterium]